MSIAMVPESQITVYLERIDRFVSHVQNFKARIDEAVNACVSGMSDKTVMAQPEPVQDTSYISPASQTYPNDSKPITADDVNIDAILEGIDLSGMDLQ